MMALKYSCSTCDTEHTYKFKSFKHWIKSFKHWISSLIRFSFGDKLRSLRMGHYVTAESSIIDAALVK